MSESLAASDRIASVPGPISFAAEASVFSSRPVIATLAPSRAYAFAVANPIPLFPPVTTATFPSNRFVDMPASFKTRNYLGLMTTLQSESNKVPNPREAIDSNLHGSDLFLSKFFQRPAPGDNLVEHGVNCLLFGGSRLEDAEILKISEE